MQKFLSIGRIGIFESMHFLSVMDHEEVDSEHEKQNDDSPEKVKFMQSTDG